MPSDKRTHVAILLRRAHVHPHRPYENAAIVTPLQHYLAGLPPLHWKGSATAPATVHIIGTPTAETRCQSLEAIGDYAGAFGDGRVILSQFTDTTIAEATIRVAQVPGLVWCVAWSHTDGTPRPSLKQVQAYVDSAIAPATAVEHTIDDDEHSILCAHSDRGETGMHWLLPGQSCPSDPGRQP